LGCGPASCGSAASGITRQLAGSAGDCDEWVNLVGQALRLPLLLNGKVAAATAYPTTPHLSLIVDHFHCGGGILNSILASWSGALPILRRKGSQRGSEWILSNRLSVTMSLSAGSWYTIALSSHSNALSALPQNE